MHINAFQCHALQQFAGGELNHITTQSELDSYGNSLLRFVMQELSEADGCDTAATAVGRIALAIGQLKEVMHGLEFVAQPSSPLLSPLSDAARFYFQF